MNSDGNNNGMIKHIFLYVIIFTLLLLLSACPNSTQSEIKNDVNIRCSIVPATAGYLKCSVFFEGPGGESVSGALVIVSDSVNQIIQLLYDYNSCSYSARIEENTDTYTFEIRSVLLNEPRLISVPYTTITRSPNITVFQDSDGNSVLNGEELNFGLPVQIAWSSSGTDITYQLSVRTALRTYYAVTTNAQTITIPGNTIPQGAYILNISAQKIYGDPAFRNADYYSLSNSSTAGLNFNVN